MPAGGCLATKIVVSTICKSQTRAATALRRHLAASDLAAGRPAGRGGISLRRLARGSGTVVVADAAARAARRVSLPVPHDVGVRGLAGAAREAAGARLSTRGRGIRRTSSVLERQLDNLRGPRRSRRSGALRTRVEGAARVRTP